MKTRLLTLLLFIFIANNVNSQTNTSDYVSGLTDPTYLSMNGTDMYVLGSVNLYRIDTTINNPIPTIIYTVPENFYLVNFTINGNLIYIALENYVEATDLFLGGRIESIDLNNLAQPAEFIYSTNEYISSLTNNGSTIYFTAETLVSPPDFEPFISHLDSIDASISDPEPETIISGLSDTSVIRGMLFDNNLVYLSSSDDNDILSIDVSQPNPIANTVVSGSFARGIFKSGNQLYMANGSLITKIDVTNPSAGSTAVAINSTYQDINNGNPFFANFRDVVLVGNMVYATLLNQGKVVKAIDNTLAISEYNSDLDAISFYNNKNTIHVTGLKNNIDVKIFSLTGQNILSEKLSINNNSMDISNLSNGVYLLNIDNKKTFKFVK
ncbi:T9SS type A sorting domain-containing protein [Formosa maritima]|uniref:T9SS type A sorting domain-containing protein n=1 Tax=Formosa maritima TaxID=2592046 RepID=A0A5D0GKZ4_9FLAO|nr:T9SS type A sorting domain-containing protein [Formosa maritima]TYA59009.1 T9SS type A sorting domain-containing protein [Formosa maritima]